MSVNDEVADVGHINSFQHSPMKGDCSCPIHRANERPPFTAPLGLPFANHVYVKPIPRSWAIEIYNCHHGYMDGDDLHKACFDHHGLYYQGNLMGAITWRFPPFSLKKMYYDDSGNIMPKPYSESDISSLPGGMRNQARELFGDIDEKDVANTEVLQGDQFVEANRICIGERMPNLASCALAASQEYLVDSECCPNKADYLVTYVRGDFSGSMIKALRDKGWKCVGWSEPKQASNREYKAIRDRFKWVFICPIESVYEQAGLSQWTED